MATGNFHNVNASKIFACELESEFDYEDLMLNLEEALKAMKCDYCCRGEDPHGLRSFPSRVLTGMGFSKEYKEFSVDMEISIIIRSGYYSGCNLDWDIKYSIEGIESNKAVFVDLLEYYVECSEKMAKHKARLAEKWAVRRSSILISGIEAIFAEFSIPLLIVGRFSDGETIYEKAG